MAKFTVAADAFVIFAQFMNELSRRYGTEEFVAELSFARRGRRCFRLRVASLKSSSV